MLIANPCKSTVRPGKRTTESDETKRTHIVWSQAERNITGLEADVLLIFDCCHAGSLCDLRGGTKGSFEFLGSCTRDQKARSAGPQSFTRALIWALKELAKGEEAFDTARLQQTILECPDFSQSREEQMPVLSHRHHLSGHVVIDRRGLPTPSATAKLAPSKIEREHARQQEEFIDIRLHSAREINSTDIDIIIDDLERLKDNEKLDISHIEYRGGRDPKFKNLVKKVMRGRATSAATSSSQVPPPLQTYLTTPGQMQQLGLGSQSQSQASTPLSATHEMEIPRTENRLYMTAPNGLLSAELSPSECDERSPLLQRRASSARHHLDDDTITYHMRAIARRLQAMVYNALAWLASKVRHGPRHKGGNGHTP